MLIVWFFIIFGNLFMNQRNSLGIVAERDCRYYIKYFLWTLVYKWISIDNFRDEFLRHVYSGKHLIFASMTFTGDMNIPSQNPEYTLSHIKIFITKYRVTVRSM